MPFGAKNVFSQVSALSPISCFIYMYICLYSTDVDLPMSVKLDLWDLVCISNGSKIPEYDWLGLMLGPNDETYLSTQKQDEGWNPK